MDPSEITISMMAPGFLLWRCLHSGPLTNENIDLFPPGSPLPWEAYRERNLPLLRQITSLYGSCVVLASHGGRAVGHLRFYPKAISRMDRAGSLCLQQDYPAGPAPDFALQAFPLFDELVDKTLVVHCLALGQPGSSSDPYHRIGIGSRMVHHLIAWAREQGWKAIEATAYHDLDLIYTITGAAGLTFWKKLGFHLVESGVEPAFEQAGEFLAALQHQAANEGIEPEQVKERFILRIEL